MRIIGVWAGFRHIISTTAAYLKNKQGRGSLLKRRVVGVCVGPKIGFPCKNT